MASHSGSRRFFIIACRTLSFKVGMPKGRFLPFALGIYTLRAGDALGVFQLLTSFTRWLGVVATSLSIPAVRFPLFV